MAMFLIAGSFRITGAQPDGDSIRFTPDDPAKWDLITGPNKVKRNASGAAQLRLDAIDACLNRQCSDRWIWQLPPTIMKYRNGRGSGSRTFADMLSSVSVVYCLMPTWR